MQNIINWIAKTDIAIIIALIGLAVTIYELHQQQQREQKQEVLRRNSEIKALEKKIEALEQTTKLQGQQLKFQAQNLEQIQFWISQFTFSKHNE
jgi:uncharacterized protein HemX